MDRKRIEPLESKLFLDDTIYARIDMPTAAIFAQNNVKLELLECSLFYPDTAKTYAILKYGCPLYPFVQVSNHK